MLILALTGLSIGVISSVSGARDLNQVNHNQKSSSSDDGEASVAVDDESSNPLYQRFTDEIFLEVRVHFVFAFFRENRTRRRRKLASNFAT